MHYYVFVIYSNKKNPSRKSRRDRFNYSSSSFFLERVIQAAVAARTINVNATLMPLSPVLGGL